jgi:pimeloyl-ACP methyl ester carboxylesterase
MSIDRAGLAALSRYRSPALGIEEAFLHPDLGGASTVAVLSRPLSEPASEIGWVICHSFGMEQIHLYRMEVRVARALSAAGFVVLRFHSQGYGDSELGASDITLASHLASAADAAALMAGTEGVGRVALLGARFGGLVAAATAGRGLADLLVLIEPVVQGRRFMRDFLWQRVFSEMATEATVSDKDPAAELMGQLTTRGWADVNGFLLRRDGFEEISKADSAMSLGAFAGPALVLSVSRTSHPSAASRGLAERLMAAAGGCRLGVIADEHAPEFGRSHFRADEEVLGKADTQLSINRAIASRVVAWARAQSAGVEP